MAENDRLMVNIFVSDFKMLKEDPPDDAVEVQILSKEEEDGTKDLLRLYEKKGGKWIPARVYAKFWSMAVPDESLPDHGT